MLWKSGIPKIMTTEMNAKKTSRRAPIKAEIKHKLNDQFGSACAVCRETTSAKLEIHHIDGDAQNSALENLLLICGGCHNEFSRGTKCEADARMFKRMAETGFLPPRKGSTEAGPAPTHVVNHGHNSGVMAQNVNIGSIKVPRDRRGKSANDLPGTIGANPDMRTYAKYLVGKYIECRQKGERWVQQYKRAFNPGSAHGILGEGFGVSNSVYEIPQRHFHVWVKSAQSKIRRTVFAKNLDHEFFHSWEEHLRQRGVQ
jgi:hypothetical protein